MKSSEAAIKLGLSKNYFMVLKIESKDKYNYIIALNEDLFKAYLLYVDETEDIKTKAIDMYYYLQERKKLTEFGRILYKKQLISQPTYFYASCTRTLFRSRIGFGKHETFIKFKTFLKDFKEHFNI